MNADKGTPIESLEAWLSNKPYWEQYVWKLNFEKNALTDEDIDQCYQYLLEHLELIEPLREEKTPISFKYEMKINSGDISAVTTKIKISEIKCFENVNAITADCFVKVGPALTLIFGGNGSGKSGVGRLLCNACFSRGEREILSNVRKTATVKSQPKATFLIDDGSPNGLEIKYSLGDKIESLKRFSVFDSKSVLIHLDQSNHVNFIPAQVKIFGKVSQTISMIEERLTIEKNLKKKDNPFQSMFLDNQTSSPAIFCKGISSSTKEVDFLSHVNFDANVDGLALADLQKQLEEKQKLDISQKKVQLSADRENLSALKTILQNVLNCLGEEKVKEINQLTEEILEKREIVTELSVQSFSDGTLNTIGSPEWKALINAAKFLYEKEKDLGDSKEPEHCMLCLQKLTNKEKSLFREYWAFLENKAENELSQLTSRLSLFLQNLQSIKITYPRFLITDAGIKIVTDEDPAYLTQLSEQFRTLEDALDDWVDNLKNLRDVSRDKIPIVDLDKIDALIKEKTNEELKLVDPKNEITRLAAQLNCLKHKKEASSVKDAALEYISFLKWAAKASGVNFAGIKMAITKKHTEFFLVGVANKYKGVFNQELAELGCNFDLVMLTSGEQGNTVKEYKLDFAEDYNPSQILSEGEQNACSIADFLTEVMLDSTNCGIILDDPVTSLDHNYKDLIAKRLVSEAAFRQVVIFTHDIVFMSKLVKYAADNNMPFLSHWIKQVNGVPGYIDENSSPKLSSVVSLKKDAKESVENFALLDAKKQEQKLGVSFDYLRSACEALIEELLFAKTIQRYDDRVKVQNLEEVIFEKDAAFKIADLHSRLSEVILAHNRSDVQRQSQPNLSDFTKFYNELETIECNLKTLQKDVRKARDERKNQNLLKKSGWDL
ncbi:MAG: hypothetical protein WC319_08410 [Candidatus Paceibacterota bacterium]|jgi:hypothetical protein